MIAPKTRNGILLLTAIAGSIIWLSQDYREADERSVGGFNTRLDYAVTDVELLVLTESGDTHMTLEAPLLTSNAETGIGVVEDPALLLHEEGTEWRIVAQSATISPDRDHVDLVGGVRVHRAATAELPEFRMVTDRMGVEVKARTAHTDAPVTMHDGPNDLHAVGMRIDFNAETFELLDQVEAIYATGLSLEP